MEKTIYDIALDLQKSCAGGSIVVKKGDTHRRLRLRLLSGGRPYPLAEDCYAVFTAQKPDGTVLYNPCVREGSNLVYDLTPQTTAAAGVLDCEIKLYGPEDALLTSAAFTVTVEDTVYTQGEEAVTSTGEASALTRLITQARETIKEMEDVLANEVNHAVIDDTKVGSDAWSAKNAVDKLCTSFAESGSVVTCQPVEGYPLEATSTIDPKADGTAWSEIKLTHCGKNLLNEEVLEITSGYYRDSSGELSSADSRFVCFGRHNCVRPDTTYTLSCNLKIYSIWFRHSSGTNLFKINANNNTSFTFTTPENCDSLRVSLFNTSGAADTVAFRWAQLEPGNTATEYEPYHGQTYTADLTVKGNTEGGYNWEVAAYPGVNTLYSDCGSTSVRGKADPSAEMEKLKNAIIALGGNV